jgi:hypothetical protein
MSNISQRTEEEKLSIGHNAVMLNHAHKTLAANRDHLDQYRRNGMKMPTQAAKKAEDMFVVGDVKIIQQAEKKEALSTLAKTGIAAALMVSGVGAGLAIPAMMASPTTPVDQQPAVNSSTEFDWKIGQPIVE